MLNDKERKLWIMNDEPLYRDWKASKLSLTKYLAENKTEVDEYINRRLHK